MKMHSAQAAMRSKPYYDNETGNNDDSYMNALDNMNKNSPIGQRATKTNDNNQSNNFTNTNVTSA